MGSIALPLEGIKLEEEKPIPPPVELPVVQDVQSTAPIEPITTKGPGYISINNTAMVPLRAIGDWLGAKIEVDKKSSVITLIMATNTLSLQLNSKTASINGKLVQLQAAPTELEGTTYIPLRVVTQAFSAKMSIDKANGTASITHPTQPAVLTLDRIYKK